MNYIDTVPLVLIASGAFFTMMLVMVYAKLIQVQQDLKDAEQAISYMITLLQHPERSEPYYPPADEYFVDSIPTEKSNVVPIKG